MLLLCGVWSETRENLLPRAPRGVVARLNVTMEHTLVDYQWVRGVRTILWEAAVGLALKALTEWWDKSEYAKSGMGKKELMSVSTKEFQAAQCLSPLRLCHPVHTLSLQSRYSFNRRLMANPTCERRKAGPSYTFQSRWRPGLVVAHASTLDRRL